MFLFLSIVNFAFGAPVVHEIHVNVADVAEDRAAASQKQRDVWLANAQDQTSTPKTLRLPDLGPRSSRRSNNAWSSSELSTGPHPRMEGDSRPGSWSPEYSPIAWVPEQSLTPSPEYSLPSSLSLTDYSPQSSTDYSLPSSPNYSPPGSPHNPHPSSPDYSPPGSPHNPIPSSPDYSPPGSIHNSLPSSPDYSPPGSTHNSHPLSPDNTQSSSVGTHLSNLPSSLLNSEPTELESMDFLSQPDPSRDPQQPTEPELMDFLSQPDPSRDPSSHAEPMTVDFLGQLGDLSRYPSSPAEPETVDFLSQLGDSSRDPAEPETKDFISQLDPSQNPPSPAVPETKDLLNQLGPDPSHHLTESETIDFLSHFWKGKIKRHIQVSGSGAMNPAQESQATIDHR